MQKREAARRLRADTRHRLAAAGTPPKQPLAGEQAMQPRHSSPGHRPPRRACVHVMPAIFHEYTQFSQVQP